MIATVVVILMHVLMVSVPCASSSKEILRNKIQEHHDSPIYPMLLADTKDRFDQFAETKDRLAMESNHSKQIPPKKSLHRRNLEVWKDPTSGENSCISIAQKCSGNGELIATRSHFVREYQFGNGAISTVKGDLCKWIKSYYHKPVTGCAGAAENSCCCCDPDFVEHSTNFLTSKFFKTSESEKSKFSECEQNLLQCDDVDCTNPPSSCAPKVDTRVEMEAWCKTREEFGNFVISGGSVCKMTTETTVQVGTHLMLTGDDPNNLAILSGEHQSRHFSVYGDLTLKYLILENGYSTRGGSISAYRNKAMLAKTSMTLHFIVVKLRNNEALNTDLDGRSEATKDFTECENSTATSGQTPNEFGGGAIYINGKGCGSLGENFETDYPLKLLLENVEFDSNFATHKGGAIHVAESAGGDVKRNIFNHRNIFCRNLDKKYFTTSCRWTINYQVIIKVVEGSSATFKKNIIYAPFNELLTYGGGAAIYMAGSETLLEVVGTNTNIRFVDNVANNGWGGAIQTKLSDIHILGGATAEFIGNIADHSGGSICLRDTTLGGFGKKIIDTDVINKFVFGHQMKTELKWKEQSDEDILQMVEELTSNFIIAGQGTTVVHDANIACWGTNSK